MLLGIVFFVGIVLDILISIFVTGNRKRSIMGVIVFCVLLLNVVIQICGGSDKWGE